MQRFIVDDEKAREFGIYLRKKRDKLNYTLEYVSNKTNISITDIHRLECAAKTRINPLHLIELANMYKINILEMYKMIGYVNDTSIIDYNNKMHNSIRVSEAEKQTQFQITEICRIPIYYGIEKDFLFDSNPDSYIYFSYHKKNIFGIYQKNNIYFFSFTKEDTIYDTLLFASYEEKNLIGRCYKNEKQIIFIPLNSFKQSLSNPIIITEKRRFDIYGTYEFFISDYIKEKKE